MRETLGGLLVLACVGHGLVLQVKPRTSNQPPAVIIESPIAESVHYAPADLSIVVVATDADGTIASVELLSDTASLGIKTGPPPYLFTALDRPPGRYTFVAKARDNLGAVTQSMSIAVQVTTTPMAPAFEVTATASQCHAVARTASPYAGGGGTVQFRESNGTDFGPAVTAPNQANGVYQMGPLAIGPAAQTFTAHWMKAGQPALVQEFALKGCGTTHAASPRPGGTARDAGASQSRHAAGVGQRADHPRAAHLRVSAARFAARGRGDGADGCLVRRGMRAQPR